MDLRVYPDADAACAAAADHIAERIRRAVEERGSASLALSGGATPERMFEELAKLEIPWSAVHLFQVDERLALEGNPDRNATALRDRLLAHVALAAANFHPMPVGLSNLLDAAEHYERALEAVCGTPPVLDVVHLGLGEDGHTASLVPGDPVLEVDDADVAPTGEYAGRARLTLTVSILRRARNLVFLVVGESKTAALRSLFDGADIPATLVARDDTAVFTDATTTPGVQLASSRHQ